jgi:hypothetical protein
MKINLFFMLLLCVTSLHLQAQSNDNNLIKGTVVLQNAKTLNQERTISNVQVSASGANPTSTDNQGKFTLTFNNKTQGSLTNITATKTGYEVVNAAALANARLPLYPNQQLLTIVMCEEGQVARNRALYYDVATKAIDNNFNKKINELKQKLSKQELNNAQYEIEYSNLIEQKKIIEAQAQDLANKYAQVNLDDASPLYQQAFELFKQGNIDGAIEVLDKADYPKKIEQYRQEEAKIARLEKDIEMRKALAHETIDTLILTAVLEANLRMNKQQFKQAENPLKRAMEVDSTNFELLMCYANYYLYRTDTVQAISMLKKAEKHASLTEQKVEALQKLIALSPTYELACIYFEKALSRLHATPNDTNNEITLALLQINFAEKYALFNVEQDKHNIINLLNASKDILSKHTNNENYQKKLNDIAKLANFLRQK